MTRDRAFILSVDDSEDAHVLLRQAFVKAGVKLDLHSLYDGAEVISYLEGEGKFGDRSKYPLPDLILLDLKMPRLSGFGVLEYLKTELPARDFRVVVFSSSENEPDVRRANELGADSYRVKPSDFRGLVDFVRELEVELLHGSRADQSVSPSEETALLAFPSSGANSESSQADVNSIISSDIFQRLVEQTKDYAIFVLDTEGYIRSWNEGARRMIGYESHEIIGKHFSVFYSRADIEGEKPQFELRMATEMSRYEDEGWRVRKDGSRFWANVVLTPIQVDGKIAGFSKITKDLTQRKFQEDNLHRLLDSEERFRLLVEQVKDYAIFFLDARGNISSWNQGARRIKGYTADEIIGKHFSIFYTPDDLATEKPARELTIAIHEGRYEEEGWRVKKDGSRFWASVVITSLWDKRGNLTGFAKVTRDLTQRKREEEALKARTAELEAFAHTLSHDLRSPLRSISSFTEMLLDEGCHPFGAEQVQVLRKIRRSAQSMEGLIRDILKLSQVSLAPAPEEYVSLDETVTEALGMLEAEVKERNAKITVLRPLPSVRANRTLLLQIFANLIGNALKFVRPNEFPSIEIFAQYRESTCDVHVKDYGPGIPQRLQNSIFNIFERGEAASASAGTGIGLAIVKRAVQRANGSITLQSSEGEGSDFIVSFPCETPAQSASASL